MHVVSLFHSLPTHRPVVLAAGFFDGLHRGHVAVLRQAVRKARAAGGEAWVLTFNTHPLKVLRPEAAPLLLTCNPHKVLLLRRLGLDGCLLVPFTRRLAGLAPEAFVRRLRRAVPTLREILVGRNWRFGRGGAGDVILLRRLGAVAGFRVTVVASRRRGAAPVSSTRIRAAVQRGDLAAARAMLGRPFSILGTVTPGRGVARALGYPTANLRPHNEVMPPAGVYAVRAWLGGRCRGGLLNYGYRPTFGAAAGPGAVLELHLLDYRGNLYGRDLEVEFLARLRPERRFASPDALRAQIARDTAAGRRVLAAAKKSSKNPFTPRRGSAIVRVQQNERAKGRKQLGV